MHTLTVTTVGNSLGVVLPKEVTSRLELKKGDKIFLTKSPDGYRITPYDPEFEEQMKAARSDGKTLIWEYPRQKPDSEQMDFVESMELNNQGLIQHHAVYWGWRGVNVMLTDAYRR